MSCETPRLFATLVSAVGRGRWQAISTSFGCGGRVLCFSFLSFIRIVLAEMDLLSPVSDPLFCLLLVSSSRLDSLG